ncbi:virion core protein, T7 gp14 family [Chromobacterium haemolyticum]|uniref:virion core protein, T7 gp14 family n=1 Tax=Chromobacterium TaxID=535 RepID=UPI004055EE15
MIGWMAGGMAAVGALESLMGGRSQNAAIDAENAAIEANIKANTLEANFAVAEATRQQQALNDAAVNDIMELRIQQMEMEGQVQAAAGETGVEGRSQDTAVRGVSGKFGRTVTSMMENFENEVSALNSQKEAIIREANSRNSNMSMMRKRKQSGAANFLNALGGGMKGFNSGYAFGTNLDFLIKGGS